MNFDRDKNVTGRLPSPPIPWHIYLLVGTMGLVLAGVVGYGLYTGNQMSAMHAPLVDATMEIKLEATTAHLWFEKIISNDRYEEMEVVWKHLDQADWYAQAMLEGGQNQEGTFIPLNNAEMRQEISSVQEKLTQFREITQQRLAARETSGVGTEIDQLYNAVFTTFINQADKVETRLQQVMARELRSFRTTQMVLIVACLLLSLFIGVAFHRFERRQVQNLLAIQDTNEYLKIEITERKRAEEQLRIVYDQFQTVMDSLDALVYVADMKTYEVLFVNKYGRDIWGDIIGTTCWQTLQSGQSKPCPFCTNDRLLNAAGEPTGVYKWKFQNTVDQQWYNCRDQVIQWPDGRLVRMEIATNITEHKQAEEALQESEALLNTTQRLTKVGGWEWDVAQQMMFWTDETYRIHGFDPNEIEAGSTEHIERSVECYDPDDRPVILEAFERCTQQGKAYDLEFPFITVQRQRKWIRTAARAVREDGKIVKVIGNIMDITERKKTRERLRQSELSLREAQKLAHIGSWLWIVETDTVAWSEELYAITGRDPQLPPPTYKEHSSLYEKESWERLSKAVERAVLEGEPYELDLNMVRLNEEVRCAFTRGRAVKDESGRVVRLYGVVQDITERKRVEEALQTRTRELALLNNASRAFASSLELDQILTSVLDHVRQIIGIVACSIWLVDQKSGNLVCREVASPKNDIVRGWRLAPGQGLARWVVQHRESLNIPNIQTDKRHFKGLDKQTSLQLRSILGVPLRTKNEVFGVLLLVDEAQNRFSPDDTRLAESLASLAAIAIENARLYKQTQQDAETKTLLLQEVNHRVKNNLAAIIGMLYIERRHAKQSGKQRSYAVIMDALISRIMGLSMVHQLLSASNWSTLSLSKLAQQVIDSALQSLPPDRRVLVDVTTAGVSMVTPREAHNLAIVINELATNVVKYAATTKETTQITLRIALEPDGETILFEFRDDGPGFPAAVLRSEGRNVGMYIIENTIRHSLRGEITLHNDNGAVVTIRFVKEME